MPIILFSDISAFEMFYNFLYNNVSCDEDMDLTLN